MTRSRGELHVEPVDDLQPLRAEWTALAEQSGNLFATWEWNALWWERFGRGRRLLIAACRDEAGTLVGVLPAYVATARGPLRLLRLIGHGPSDRLGPVCAPADRPDVARALRGALRSRPWRGGVLLAEDTPGEERWSFLLAGRTLTRTASPQLDIATTDWEAFLAGLRRQLRRELRKDARLAEEAGARARRIESAGELAGGLDALFALHRRRWGDAAAPAFAGQEDFHRAFAAVALDRGWLRLWLLELDGTPVGAMQCFRFGGADWYYQAGRDPEYEHVRVGAVLLTRAIRDCIEAGGRRFLFLRGAERYKERFATADHGVETFALGAGGAGRAAVTASAAVPAGPRRAVARRLGI